MLTLNTLIKNNEIKEALKSFKAIEHRLEFIRTIENTDYYNDSKATNPEASIVAINSFSVILVKEIPKKSCIEEADSFIYFITLKLKYRYSTLKF